MKILKIDWRYCLISTLLLISLSRVNAASTPISYSYELFHYIQEVSSVAELDLSAWVHESPIVIIRVYSLPDSGNPLFKYDVKSGTNDIVEVKYSTRCEIIETLSGELPTKEWKQEWTDEYKSTRDYENHSKAICKNRDPYSNLQPIVQGEQVPDERCFAAKVNLDRDKGDKLTVLCELPVSLFKDFGVAFEHLRKTGAVDTQNSEFLTAESNTFLAIHVFGQMLQNGEYDRCVSEMMKTKDVFRQAVFAYMCSCECIPRRDEPRVSIKALMEQLDIELQRMAHPEYKTVEGIALGIYVSKCTSPVRSRYSQSPMERIAIMFRLSSSRDIGISGFVQFLKRLDPENPDSFKYKMKHKKSGEDSQ